MEGVGGDDERQGYEEQGEAKPEAKGRRGDGATGRRGEGTVVGRRKIAREGRCERGMAGWALTGSCPSFPSASTMALSRSRIQPRSLVLTSTLTRWNPPSNDFTAL